MIWTILEVIFLFFFFKLPPVDDFIKSKYDEHLEHNQIQSSESDKQNEAGKQGGDEVNQNVEEQLSNCDASVSISDHENAPLLRTHCMNGVQKPETSHKSVTPPSQSFMRKFHWLLDG